MKGTPVECTIVGVTVVFVLLLPMFPDTHPVGAVGTVTSE